jgi:hypothetical protein
MTRVDALLSAAFAAILLATACSGGDDSPSADVSRGGAAASGAPAVTALAGTAGTAGSGAGPTFSSSSGGMGMSDPEAPPVEEPSGVLCLPCDTRADCPGQNNMCIRIDNTGEKFCGKDCSSEACPPGFSCRTVPQPSSGDVFQQCVPNSLTCEAQPPRVPGQEGGEGAISVVPLPADAVGSLAARVTIAQIALYQAVKIPIMREGVAVMPLNAPIIVGRKALIRIFVQPEAGFTPRTLAAELELNGQKHFAQAEIAAASSDADPSTTFNFILSGNELPASVNIAATLHELPGAAADPGNVAPGARWPASASASLPMTDTRGGLRITFVPLEIDGSTGNATPEHAARLIESMMQVYPVAEVPFEIAPVLSLNTTSWTGALQGVAEQRERDDAPPEDFYYGLVAGGGAGVQGISYTVSNPNQLHPRASVGKDAETSIDTLPHEIGHALGREHAPCGTSGDRDYPYEGASIGTWGFDIDTERLLGPDTFKDLMSYCDPAFISDHNYREIADRILSMKMLSEGGDIAPARTRGPAFERVLLHESDAEVLEARGASIDGSTEVAVVLTLRGGGTRQLRARFFPHAHTATGLLLLDPGALSGATALAVAGGTARPLR